MNGLDALRCVETQVDIVYIVLGNPAVMNQFNILASSHPAEPPQVNMPTVVRGFYMQPVTIDCSVESDLPYRLRLTKGGSTIGEERTYE